MNSCPMFTFNERDLQRMPKPAKAHLPIRADIDLGLIDDETGREHEVKEGRKKSRSYISLWNNLLTCFI